MKKIYSVLIIIMIMGALVAMASYTEAMLVIKDKRINLNTASQSDFDEKAIIDGEISFVYGPFATYEETSKKYGVTVSKKETNYYIVGNFSEDMLSGDEDYDEFYVIYSASDKDMVSKLDDAADKWYNWLTDENEESLPPEVRIEFSGKLWTEPTEDDYIKYRDEAFDDLTNIGIDKSMYAELKINDGEVGKSSVALFFGSIAVAVIALVILIASIVKSKKASSEEFY